MLALLVFERVGLGHEVPAHAIGVDELDDARGLGHVVVVGGRDVLDPADRLVRDPQRLEDLVVEAVLAEQQPVDLPQEVTRLGALDDPVVVGAGQRHDLGDGQTRERVGGGPLVFGRVFHRADADDRALAGHEARNGVDRADGAGVGQRDRGAGEVVDAQLAGASLADDVFVGDPELPEVHLLRALDGGHEELAVTVALLHVDGQAEADVLGLDQGRLAVDLRVGVVHLRHGAQRLDDREADQMGEGDLAATAPLQVIVDHDAVVDEQLGRDGPHAGRRRNRQ